MMRNLLMASLVVTFLVGSAGGAQAQRGGSVRFSGSAARTTTSVSRTTSAGTPVRYQRPMNTGGGTVARTTTTTATRWQAPVNLAVGTSVRALPTGYRAMAVAGRNYYSYGGAYYAADDAGAYTVVPPPLGATVDALPVGAVEISPGLYEYNGVKYRPAYEDGQVVYIVSN